MAIISSAKAADLKVDGEEHSDNVRGEGTKRVGVRELKKGMKRYARPYMLSISSSVSGRHGAHVSTSRLRASATAIN
jgi:hypothetical protein